MKNKLKLLFPLTLIAGIAITACDNSPFQSKSSQQIMLVQTNNLNATNSEDLFEAPEENIEYTIEETAPTVLTEKVAMYPEFVFEKTNTTAYFIEDAVVKDRPYEDADDSATYKKYDEIILTGTNDLDFWEVTVNDNTFYVNKKSITTDKSVIDNMKEEERLEAERQQAKAIKEEKDDYVWTTTALNVRTGPDADYYESITVLSAGEKVKRTGICNNGWSRVEINGKEYYVCSKYITTTDPTAQKSTNTNSSSESTNTTSGSCEGVTLQYSAAYNITSNKLTASKGVVYYNGHKETYYSQRVLPGGGLKIPGRHVADDGTVRDGDGYICIAANYLPKGATIMTSLGPGKVYDCGGMTGEWIDIYVDW